MDLLNTRGIAEPSDFARLVKARDIDMTMIPEDLAGYDFTWSACSLGHLGNLERGLTFVEDSLKTLKPGGIAVHTTEVNLSSNTLTYENTNTSVLRRRDVEALAKRLRASGHKVSVNYNDGKGELDTYVDAVPYSNDRHIKIELGVYVITAFGFIVRKNQNP